jgi:copper chaperone
MLRAWVVVAAIALFSGEAMANESNATLQVSGWHCGGCSSATETSVKKVTGVKSAKADLDKGTLAVAFDDSKATTADLEKAVESAGFKVVHKK